LAPTVGIAATGFCYPGGILQLFHRRYQQIFSTSSRSTTRTAEDSWSKDTEQCEEIKINKFCGCEQQPDGSINLQQASTRSSNFSTADSSSQIASTKFIINKQRHINFVIAVSYERLVHRHEIIEQQGSNYEKGHRLFVLVIAYPCRC
jgi:hypothetical protein